MIRSESSSIFSIIGAFILGGIALAVAGNLMRGDSSYFQWMSMKAQEDSLQGELSRLDAEQKELSRQIRLLQSDPEYVEKVIRQRLNYVREGEVLYIFDEKGKRQEKWLGAQIRSER